MQRYLSFVAPLAWAAAALADGSPATLYRIETVAGSPNPGDGGPALAAQIGTIQGIAIDRLGNIYLSDTDNHRVRKVSAAGIITTVAGTGSEGFSGDGGPAAGAQLNLPYGLAVDLIGNLYVADLGNNRVRRIAPDGTITTFAGNGQKGSAGDRGPAASAQMLTPRNLAVDAGGNLYISEFEGHRVRKVSPDGTITTVAGTGVVGFRGDGGPALTAQLAYPAGLALDRTGALYVADSQNHRIRKMAIGGAIVTALGGTPGTALSVPVSLTVDPVGAMYVGEQFPGDVVAYTPAGVFSAVANSPANDLAVDVYGNLYLAAGGQVRVLKTSGATQIVAGDAYVHVGDGGGAGAAALLRPSAVALDAAGNLYIADTGTQRIRRVLVTGQIGTVAGTGVEGNSGDGGPAAAAQLSSPAGVTADLFGNLTIADAGNQKIRQVGPDGRIRTVQKVGGNTGQATRPGVCTDRAGAVYVADPGNDVVWRMAPGAKPVTVAGTGTLGDAGDGGLALLAQLNQPTACAADSAGNLFLSDTMNHRIRKITPAGSITTVAGTAVAGLAGDGGLATAANLSAPAGVAVDDNGNIYIADTGNNLLRKVTPDGIMHTIAGADPAALLDGPRGLALDGAGNLYFADSGHNLIRRLVPQSAPPPEPAVETPPFSVWSAASLSSGPVAPGETITIMGGGLGPVSGIVGAADANGMYPTVVGGTEVRFDGLPGPVFYAQSGQVNAQVPYTVAGAAVTKIEVRYLGQTQGNLSVAVVDAAPALFPAVANQDGSSNSPDQPAALSSVITLYATGEGLTDGANVAGQRATPPYACPRLPVTLTIAGIPVEVDYAGSAPGLAGIMQINARTPAGFVPSGQAAVVLTVGTAVSPALAVWLE